MKRTKTIFLEITNYKEKKKVVKEEEKDGDSKCVRVCVCVCVCVCGDYYLFIYLMLCQGVAMELVKVCSYTVKGCDGTLHHDRNPPAVGHFLLQKS